MIAVAATTGPAIIKIGILLYPTDACSIVISGGENFVFFSTFTAYNYMKNISSLNHNKLFEQAKLLKVKNELSLN